MRTIVIATASLMLWTLGVAGGQTRVGHREGGAQAAEPPPLKAMEIDLSRLQPPSREDRQAVEDWIIDLETSVMLADRIGVVATGEYFQASGNGRSQQMDANRFVFSWAFDHASDRQRIVFGNEDLLGAVEVGSPDDRYARASGSKYDQLKIEDVFHESIGNERREPDKRGILDDLLKISGLFYPVTACTATVTELRTGTARDPRKARVDLPHLTGIYRRGDKTFAEFTYQWQRQIQTHRVVIFRKGVPVQVSDYLAMTPPSRPFAELELQDRSEEHGQQLSAMREIVRPQAQTLIRWEKVSKLDLPVALRSMTLGGDVAIEVDARFKWLVNQQIDDRLFDPDSVGRLGATAMLP